MRMNWLLLLFLTWMIWMDALTLRAPRALYCFTLKNPIRWVGGGDWWKNNFQKKSAWSMDLEQRPKKIIFNAFLRYNSFYFFMHFLAARAALFLPCWLTHSLTDWLFWIQLQTFDQTIPNLLDISMRPTFLTHLKYLATWHTHPPEPPTHLSYPPNWFTLMSI